MMIKNLYHKKILFPVLGFGLAGAIWGGWDLYGSTPPADYPLTIIGAVLLGVFGGLGLALPTTRSAKKITKIVGLGLVGAVLGFILAWVGIYNLSILGSYIASILPGTVIDMLGLKPSLPITLYWINFALAGAFLGLFFAIGLKERILTMILRGAAGFGLAAIVGPILGNLIGNLFNSLLIAYLFTFLIIGVVLGLFLSFRVDRVNKEEKEGSMPT